MSSASKENSRLLDPFSEKINERISSIFHEVIDRMRLRAFVYSRAKRILLKNHPIWETEMEKESLDRLIEANVKIDYNTRLEQIVREFIESIKQENKVSEVIPKTEEVVLVREVKIVQKIEGIDKAVASGRRTKLHIACEEGDYQEVVRLVEECGATIHIKDSSNWTPKDRCRLNNKTEDHARILVYLDNFSQK